MSPRNRRRIRAVIFDLDGTLIDSEPNYRAVDVAFLAARGIELSEAEWDGVIGMGGEPFIAYLSERFGLEEDVTSLVAEKDDRYLEYATGRTRAFPATRELVRYLYVHGYPLAVATSSRRRILDVTLSEAGLASYFDVTVAGDEVRHSKPAPDIFLEACRRLSSVRGESIDPRECLVLEDSRFGAAAAKRAGMTVIAVPAKDTPHRDEFAGADICVDGGPDALDFDATIDYVPPSALAGTSTSASAARDRAAEDERADAAVARFAEVVRDFYAESRRPMPWRETRDPYAILVSEFMLQQTQVARVDPKYRSFLERFPSVVDLAGASLPEVVALWRGLGYNRRAKNLLESARAIVDRFDGFVPASVLDLMTLPGVGAYTASAVAAFAFGRRTIVVETNIRRVFLHFFRPADERVPDREIEALVERTLPHDGIREWYYALMDYGSMLGRVFPNANRRSAHYSRQSRFAGSVREVRGSIVRALSTHGSMRIEELERRVGPTDERFPRAIEGLERDGMIVRDDRIVMLCE